MRRLICTFVVCIWLKQVFSWRGSYKTDYKSSFWFILITHPYYPHPYYPSLLPASLLPASLLPILITRILITRILITHPYYPHPYYPLLPFILITRILFISKSFCHLLSSSSFPLHLFIFNSWHREHLHKRQLGIIHLYWLSRSPLHLLLLFSILYNIYLHSQCIYWKSL